ncbi:hypothetical protein [Nostoc sp. CHAB 5715]|uniref:hypothetical protein n=1 Tax=Nostoc sp. CHAB 5715 TaxID=2780400 RepID=UPI001E325C92|nr:hypothetical protein [Nostoc sp. CHAB 5715]MCC5621527.1 hypothetical protein [Nostoc sp. CHAB 5715]
MERRLPLLAQSAVGIQTSEDKENNPCPIPHAPCPMPNAPCPMPHAPCPITNTRVLLGMRV